MQSHSDSFVAFDGSKSANPENAASCFYLRLSCTTHTLWIPGEAEKKATMTQWAGYESWTHIPSQPAGRLGLITSLHQSRSAEQTVGSTKVDLCLVQQTLLMQHHVFLVTAPHHLHLACKHCDWRGNRKTTITFHRNSSLLRRTSCWTKWLTLVWPYSPIDTQAQYS